VPEGILTNNEKRRNTANRKAAGLPSDKHLRHAGSMMFTGRGKGPPGAYHPIVNAFLLGEIQ
jgi:hypothetical protein